MPPVRRQISPYASRLRRDQTDVERTFWAAVSDRRLGGCKFRRQATIGHYVVDFRCIEHRLIVELDGGQHNEEADAHRTAVLEHQGDRILRFWNTDAVANLAGVLDATLIALTDPEEKTLTSLAAALPPGQGKERPNSSPAKTGEG